MESTRKQVVTVVAAYSALITFLVAYDYFWKGNVPREPSPSPLSMSRPTALCATLWIIYFLFWIKSGAHDFLSTMGAFVRVHLPAVLLWTVIIASLNLFTSDESLQFMFIMILAPTILAISASILLNVHLKERKRVQQEEARDKCRNIF